MMSPEGSRCDRCERESRDASFDRLARRYGRDAAHDYRRSLVFGVLAVGATIAAGASGVVLLKDDHGRLSRGLAAAAVVLVCTLPFWWAAERSRRSGAENRRLRRQAESVEPFVAGFTPEHRDTMRASLAQVLFSRTVEDNDPIRAPTWQPIAPGPPAK